MSAKHNHSLAKFIAILFLLVFVFSLGANFGGELSFLGKGRAITPDSKTFLGDSVKKEDFDFSAFWEAVAILEEKFIDKDNIEPEKLTQGAIRGAVRSLGDPYTEYLPPKEAQQFIDNVRGSFEGIGAEIGFRKEILTVIAPLEASPAQKAGLKAGDSILAIDGVSTLDMSLEEAVGRIRGPKGTAVVLTIGREENNSITDISIVRDTIAIPVVEWRLLEDNPDIAYVRVFHFTESARSVFSKTAQEILRSPAKKIILDLRNNPGGFLEVSVDIAGWFLDEQALVAREKFSDGSEKLYRTKKNSALETYPMVVLVNQGSASAAEILAGALRDDRKIPLIGMQTFGKGSVQVLEPITDGGSLKVTVARWLTPNGTSIEGKGLAPDFEVALSEENESKDPQLEKAVEILKR